MCPRELPAEEKYIAKDGIKAQLLKLAKARGPKSAEIIEAINYIIRDKKLVGYHLPMKMADFGMIGQMQQRSAEGLSYDGMLSLVNQKFTNGAADEESKANSGPGNICLGASGLIADNMFDIAKIFNRGAACKQQIPFDLLCANELNLGYKKKCYPFIYTEAKISMALYTRWVHLKNGGKVTTSPTLGQAQDAPKLPRQPAAFECPKAEKENQNPNHSTKTTNSENHPSFQDFAEKFQDKNIPVEMPSAPMIRFLIEEAVKQCFKEEMT